MTKSPRAGSRPADLSASCSASAIRRSFRREQRSASGRPALGRLHAAAVDLVELVARHDDERNLHHGLRGLLALDKLICEPDLDPTHKGRLLGYDIVDAAHPHHFLRRRAEHRAWDLSLAA